MAERRPRPAAARPLRGRDPLGLRRALNDRLLPALVGAMALLAALAITGAEGAGHLAARWEQAAAGQLIMQLPPEAAPAALERLRAAPGVAAAAAVPEEQLRQLLVPWLGEVPGLPLPAMLEVRLASPDAEGAVREIAGAIPGAAVEQRGEAVVQALRLAEGVRALAWFILGVIGLVATALVAVATRAGIAAAGQTIVILHELGARDSDIAGRFAGRLALLCAGGASAGLLVALPALWLLARATLPLTLAREAGAADLPWAALALLPVAAAGIGWLTARVTVAGWLRRLP